MRCTLSIASQMFLHPNYTDMCFDAEEGHQHLTQRRQESWDATKTVVAESYKCSCNAEPIERHQFFTNNTSWPGFLNTNTVIEMLSADGLLNDFREASNEHNVVGAGGLRGH